MGLRRQGLLGRWIVLIEWEEHAVEVNGLAVTEFVFNITGHLIGIEVVSEADDLFLLGIRSDKESLRERTVRFTRTLAIMKQLAMPTALSL